MSDSFATPWAVACQAPLSMGFPRQGPWSGLPFPSPGDLPDPSIKPASPALHSLLLSYYRSPRKIRWANLRCGIPRASQAALVVKNLPASVGGERQWFSPLVGKIPWSRNPLNYSFLGNSTDRGAWQAIYSPWGHKESDRTGHGRTLHATYQGIGWEV